jgi:hypothetical protein
MNVREKIKILLSENYKSPNGHFGESQNKGKLFLQERDAERKREERKKLKDQTKKDTPKKDTPKDTQDPKDIQNEKRRKLKGELRLTPLETVISRLIAYLDTGKSKHMSEIFSILDDYPKLKKFVKDKSMKSLPKYEFKVFAARELLDEEIGSTGYRSETGYHNWTLSKNMVEKLFKENNDYYIMECKVNPADVVIFIPAFTTMMEQLILEGLVDEPMHNIIRDAKITDEIVLPAEKYNCGYIIEVKE